MDSKAHKPIGGYLPLEISRGRAFHPDALALASARNCIEYILQAKGYKAAYLPHYCCGALVEPFKSQGIEIRYYHIVDSFAPTSLPELSPDEVFLYVNYFGINTRNAREIAQRYGEQTIIDNSQAFFAAHIPGVDTVYSARKFFGMADGAYLYTDRLLDAELPIDSSYNRMSHLLKRVDLGAEAGYADFSANEDFLCHRGVMRMSRLTYLILSGVDYTDVAKRRRENFQFLHKSLGPVNKLSVNLEENEVPLAYPFMTDDPCLRAKLIEQKIFVPQYWKFCDSAAEQTPFEAGLRSNMCALPLSQDCDLDDMQIIINTINNFK